MEASHIEQHQGRSHAHVRSRRHVSRFPGTTCDSTLITDNSGLLTSILRFAGYFFHSPTSDTTYAGVYLYIYVVCESGMYLVAACLLTYKPLAKLFRKDGPLSINRTRFKSMTWGVSDNSSRASTGTANMPLRNSRKDRFEPLEETGSRATKSSRETDFV